MGKHSASRGKKQLPTKWLALIVVGFVGYALLQPVANKRLGWSLPSAASLLGEGKDAAKKDSGKSEAGQGSRKSTSADKTTGGKASEAKSNDRSESGQSTSGPTYDYLREVGRNVYMSPEGLEYGPMGGPDKHRLVHVQHHLSDSPERPTHGVFDGDMPQVLRWIDDGYARAKDKDKSVKKKSEGNRDVYEISFGKQIGYKGGRSGKRGSYPPARSMRLVLEGNRVITAFPTTK